VILIKVYECCRSSLPLLYRCGFSFLGYITAQLSIYVGFGFCSWLGIHNNILMQVRAATMQLDHKNMAWHMPFLFFCVGAVQDVCISRIDSCLVYRIDECICVVWRHPQVARSW
jgi:hypothetical protein